MLRTERRPIPSPRSGGENNSKEIEKERFPLLFNFLSGALFYLSENHVIHKGFSGKLVPLLQYDRVSVDFRYGMEFASDQYGNSRLNLFSLERIRCVLDFHGNVSVLDFHYRHAIPFVTARKSDREFFPVKRILPVFDGKSD